MEISRFHVRFQDFQKDYARFLARFQWRFCKISRFQWRFLQDFQILIQILTYWFWISRWCDYLLQRDSVDINTLYFVYVGYRHNVQAGHSHLHPYMREDWPRTITSLGNLQYSLESHTPSAKGVACETYTYIIGIYIFLCTTVSHYYRETCFKLATCADFSISNSGDYQFPDW